MREIKFRAWDGKKIIYNVIPFQHDFVIDRMSWKCIESDGTGFLGSGGTEAKFELTGYAFKELMQYTGLKDKNGKEIYEGYIIQYDYHRYQVVSVYSLGFDRINPEAYEVIGNIYENPELLEK